MIINWKKIDRLLLPPSWAIQKEAEPKRNAIYVVMAAIQTKTYLILYMTNSSKALLPRYLDKLQATNENLGKPLQILFSTYLVVESI